MTTKKIYSPWIKWSGGECSVPLETLVQVKFRDGTVEPAQTASEYYWYHDGGDDDIVEYCIVTVLTDLEAAEQLLHVNGYTVTKPLPFEDLVPMKEIPPKGTEFWVVSALENEGVYHTWVDDKEVASQIIKRRMAYLDKEHALIAARHLFGLKGGEL